MQLKEGVFRWKIPAGHQEAKTQEKRQKSCFAPIFGLMFVGKGI
jgi:hypothetical protein